MKTLEVVVFCLKLIIFSQLFKSRFSRLLFLLLFSDKNLVLFMYRLIKKIELVNQTQSLLRTVYIHVLEKDMNLCDYPILFVRIPTRWHTIQDYIRKDINPLSFSFHSIEYRQLLNFKPSHVAHYIHAHVLITKPINVFLYFFSCVHVYFHSSWTILLFIKKICKNTPCVEMNFFLKFIYSKSIQLHQQQNDVTPSTNWWPTVTSSIITNLVHLLQIHFFSNLTHQLWLKPASTILEFKMRVKRSHKCLGYLVTLH